MDFQELQKRTDLKGNKTNIIEDRYKEALKKSKKIL
jgi:hypothetical protein